MGQEDGSTHEHSEGDVDRTGRYVPLHVLQEKYGELYSVTGQAPILPKAILPAKIAGSDHDRKKMRNKKGDYSIVTAKATELIRGFEPFDLECLGDGARNGQRRFAQVKQDSTMHDEFLASLCELRCLETELDLTFQAVKSFCSSGPRASSAAVTTFSSPLAESDEIVLDVELQKFGSTYSVVFRAPQTWELHQPGAVKRTHKLWGARPKLTQLSGGWVTSDFSKYSTPVHAVVGDSAHTLSLELCERLPEMIMLRRSVQGCRPSSAARETGGRVSPDGISGNAALALTPATPGNSMGEGLAAEGAVDAQCKAVERNFIQKISGHYRQLSEGLGLPTMPTHVMGPTAAAQYAADLVEAATCIRARTKEYAQEYIREIRSALRLVGPTMSSAARVIEGAVKGIVVALDQSLSAGWQQAEQLERHTKALEKDRVEAEMLRSRVRDLERENGTLKAKLSTTEQQSRDESKNLKKTIDVLKIEIEKLSPDQSDLEGVAGLMREYDMLMGDLVEESTKHTTILDLMTTYTKNVVGDATAEPSERKRRSNGRVVELLNGELLLRPHEIADLSTQVTELDLLTINLDAPVRLRMPRIRQIMTAFASVNTPVITLHELDAEIDKIYHAKMKADQDAELATLPRSELADFVVEFYLDSLRSVEQAQAKFCSILRCLQSADRNALDVPLKIQLFQRFLEFCEYDQALPLTVLNIVLQAKRYATAQLLKQKQTGTEPKATRQTTKGALDAPAQEPQLRVDLAYAAAAKALPHRIPAMREFFAGLSSRAEIDTKKSPIEHELLVLLLLLHDRLHKEGAASLRELIQRAEQRGTVSADEFREAVRDARVQAIDDSVWRAKLSDPANPGQLCSELMLDYLGGGSQARIPGATIAESGFMAAITEAVAADYEDRLKHMQGLWQRSAQQQGTKGSLGYAEFESVVHSDEPNMAAPMLRTLFLNAVELSRGCSQLNGDPCLPVGTLQPVLNVQDEYGGEVVTFPFFAKAALKCGLFLKDYSGAEVSIAHGDKAGTGAKLGFAASTSIGRKAPPGTRSSVAPKSGATKR